jgi:hypothetical protein
MRTNGDTNGDRTARLTVQDAADYLGISTEAARQRIKRGTLPTERDSDGSVRVLLDADSTRTNADPTRTNDRTDGDGTADQALMAAHLDHLEQEVEFLRAELRRREEDHREETRRKDHIIAAALERIPPQLSAPQKPSESPQSDGADAGGVGHPHDDNGADRRSWWRRWFGFE